MVNVQRLAIVQLTCSSQIQYQRDAGQSSFKHIIFRTELCRAAASSRACQLSRAGLCVSLYTFHVWYVYVEIPFSSAPWHSSVRTKGTLLSGT